MTRVIVAGVVNVRVARRCASFPVPFVSNAFEPGGISIRLSGTGWTISRTLQRLGTDVVFATYVGADELGQFVSHGLLRRGLLGATTLVCPVQPRALVLYSGDGRRANITDLRATPDLEYPTDVFAAALDSGASHSGVPWDGAVLTNIGFTRKLIPLAMDRGIPIATDLHLVDAVDSPYNRDWMCAARILACSHEALPITPEEWVGAMWRRFGTDLVLVGCGADGAVIGDRRTRATWHIRPMTPRGVRYTSGAGDTLLASFVHHYFTHGDPVTATRQAVLTAGWKVGGNPDDEPGVPSRQLHEICADEGLPRVVRLR